MSRSKPRVLKQPYARNRREDNILPSFYDIWDTNTATGVTTHSSNHASTGNHVGQVNEMYDIVVPGWREYLERGVFINNPMTKRNYGRESVSSTVTMIHKPGGGSTHDYQLIGDLMGYYQLAFGSSFPDNIVEPTLIETKLDLVTLQKIASVRTWANVQGADTLALVTAYEAEKTISMFRTACERLLLGAVQFEKQKISIMKLITAVGLAKGVRRSVKRRQIRRYQQQIDSLWLEYRYGWSPLVYDIQGTMKALYSTFKEYYTARGYAKNSVSEVTTANVGSTDPSTGTPWTVLRTKTYTANVRGYVLYKVDSGYLLPGKLGLLALPETIWEVVPFSFVVDWFVRVGDWLAAITPKVGINIIMQGYTVEKWVTCTRQITATSPSSAWSWSGVVGLSDYTWDMSKQRLTTLSIPPVPPVNVQYNVKRTLDSLALLLQQIKRVH